MPDNTVTRELIVTLSEAELRERGDEMAVAELESESFKKERRQLNASIRARTDLRNKLAIAIDARKETREVVCEWRPNYKTKRWQLVRSDTKEVLPEEREMTPADLQVRLIGAPAEGEDAAPAGARNRKKAGARKAAKR